MARIVEAIGRYKAGAVSCEETADAPEPDPEPEAS